MAMTVNYNQAVALNIPINMAAVYQIVTTIGIVNYVGVAERGQAQRHVLKHLDEGRIPGGKVVVEQSASMSNARSREQEIIQMHKPKYNEPEA